jgi:hypothetical protein
MTDEWELVEETEVLAENLPPMPLCRPQIPHDLTWEQTLGQGAMVESQQLTPQPQLGSLSYDDMLLLLHT